MRLWPHRVHPRYIVMELCTGGDLCGRLRQPNNRHGVGEKGIATMMEEMLAAVYYLHDHGVVHRGAFSLWLSHQPRPLTSRARIQPSRRHQAGQRVPVFEPGWGYGVGLGLGHL